MPGYVTRQRQIIAECLTGHAEFITVQDLHHLMRSAGHRIGLSTVYRTLSALVAAGAADTFRDTSGVQHYRARTTGDHQHYLVCRACGISEPVASDIVERWAEDTARRLGFAEVAHVVELSGVCRTCQKPDGLCL
ncbi:transcriptional repressor [Catenulispora sp. NL8]|uniref:Transcriptional repressor n=1 Tax=Catenulispora pinistramenti TaxID=2705254 RepID=A0ABS5KRF1_9ACTN|nr:Fur family transcriptional regulator [Catenulispora pinistramenti]MBS2548617.1 transcriptional repressor [Catenulispora pinistramenti]